MSLSSVLLILGNGFRTFIFTKFRKSFARFSEFQCREQKNSCPIYELCSLHVVFQISSLSPNSSRISAEARLNQEVKCLAAYSPDGTVQPFSYSIEGDLKDDCKKKKKQKAKLELQIPIFF